MNYTRITPESVVAAYMVTGMRPARGAYLDSRGCGCALGALSFAALKVKACEPSRLNTGLSLLVHTLGGLDYKTNGFNTYCSGFLLGFDGGLFDWTMAPDAEIGYKDGITAWEAVGRPR